MTVARAKPLAAAFDSEPANSIGYLIRDSSRMILSRLQALLEPHNVTLGQYFVLRELWQNEGVTQRELCARIGIGEQSAVATIDAMEARDLVVRTRSRQDRRKIQLYLTDRSRGLRDELLGYAAQVINAATADFAPGEIATLRGLLRKLNDRLERT